MDEVARELGIAKTTVLRNLRILGISLRPSLSSPAGKIARNRNYNSGRTPYGHLVIRGRLVEHPKEMQVIHKMLALWKSGLSFRAIASKLNSLGIKTRKGSPWWQATVAAIIRRESKDSLKQTRGED